MLCTNTNFSFLPLVCELAHVKWENLFLEPCVKASHIDISEKKKVCCLSSVHNIYKNMGIQKILKLQLLYSYEWLLALLKSYFSHNALVAVI
jgi:hypothetical protein